MSEEALPMLRAEPLRRFRRYPAYKDSGVEWLGEIPAHWEVKRLKTLLHSLESGRREDSLAGAEDDSAFSIGGEHVGTSGQLLLANERFISGAAYDRMNAGRVAVGDVLLVKDGATIGKTAHVDTLPFPRMAVNEHVFILRTEADVESRFLYYGMASDVGQCQIDLCIRGAAQPGLPSSFAGDLVIPLPSPPEQRAIAAFLDRETARIDALVAKKERLIELLQEKRTALITRAVTKGLDPTVPMKDSGVEWLGEIPAHWEVVALKRRARRIQTGTTPPTSEVLYYEDGVVPWYAPGSFTDELPLKSPAKLISESAFRDGVARLFEAGSVAVVTIGATIGKVAYMEQAGSANQQITCITFNRGVHSKYGAYQLKRLEHVLRGIAPTTTLPILDQEEVGYLTFAVPPEPEQLAIVAFLDRETARIDALIAKVREAIDRLKELRTALISAAVTGKIDVREEAAA